MKYASGHERVLIDNGEFLCECGWVPSWNSELNLEDQYSKHVAE